MPGNPIRREKAEMRKRQQNEILKLETRLATSDSPDKSLADVTNADLKGCDGSRARVERLFELTGHNPQLRAIFLLELRTHVIPYLKMIDELCDNGMLTEEECEGLRDLQAFLEKVPLDTRDALKGELDLLKWQAPQLKASEVKQTVDQTISINVQKFGE